MQQDINAAGRIAPLRNVVNFDSLMRRLQSAPGNLPRIGVMYGNSGLGKTFAATFAANEHKAYHVQVGFSWTQRYFCKMVMVELSLCRPDENPKGCIPELIAAIAGQLAKSGRILIIDDSQYLEKKGMIELVRDIYEAAQSPLVMIGEEDLPTILKRWERVHNRVLSWVKAQACNEADCKALARLVCGGLDVAGDLLEKVRAAAGGCARRVVTSLAHIHEFAEVRGMAAIDAAGYTAQIDTGDHGGQ